MDWQNIPYMILLTLSGIGTAILAVYVWWRRRAAPEAWTLILLMSAVAAWSLTYLIEIGSTEFAAKVFWLKVEYLGIVTLPTAWLCFAIQFTKRDTWLRPRNLILLSIEPLIILVLVWSNNAHHLFWKGLKLEEDALFSALVLDRGVGAWVHVAYSYLLLALGAFLIAETLIRSSHLYRRQAAIMLIALSAPWIGNAMYITGWNPFPHLDLTPFAFTITCVACVYGLFRFRLLDIVPIAREAIVENIGDAVIVLDAQNRLVDFNPAAESILDTTASKAIGQQVEQVFSGWPELLKHCREETDTSVVIVKSKGESQQFFDMRISPLYDRHGTMAGRLALLHDITERKRAEELLRQSEEKYRTLFEESRDVVYITTPEGRIVDMNPAGFELLGYSSKEELSEVDVARDSYWDPHDRETFRKTIAENEFVRDLELNLKTKDGRKITVLVSTNAVLDDKGTVLEYRGIMHDVTKRKQLEYQLHQSSKLAAIGELAAGVAHEINNPIATIEVYAGLINDVLEDLKDKAKDSCSEQINQYVGTIEQQVERCRSTVNSLLSFARVPQRKGESFGINELLQETTRMVSSISGSDADVELKLDPELPSYWGSPDLLQQVFVNLLSNAFKATGANGKITLSTHLNNDGDISIQFTDSGYGIPEEIKDRIFEPFFTTSPEGEGTGLGLSITYYIVKQMNGEISVDSTPGHGTSFVVTLPLANSAADDSPSE